MNAKSPNNIFSIITWINALIALAMVIQHHFGGGISSKFQMAYFILMIGATGIPHGAMDHIIAKHGPGADSKGFSIQSFLGKYILAILLYAITWVYFPSISLIIFLLISAWHFGETDLSGLGASVAEMACRFCWGMMLLMLILFTHMEDTTQMILRITANSRNATDVLAWIGNHKNAILATGIILTLSALPWIYKRMKHPFTISYLSNLFIIMVLCTLLPLLPAFALYFGGWHAIRSFEITYKFLHQSQDESATGPLTLWKNALPMSFLAAVGFVFIAFIWQGIGLQLDPVPAGFIFLSVITLPHLDVMDTLIRKQQARWRHA